MKPEPIRWWEVVGVLVVAACAAVFLFGCPRLHAATLSFTLPTTKSALPASCSSPASCTNLAGWRVYAQVQSVAWERHRETMKTSSIHWAIYWPTVSSEALPIQVRSASTLHLPGRGVGQRISVSVPDSLDVVTPDGPVRRRVLLWTVETFNDSLRVSCPASVGAR